jgi:hypothetical protein
MFANEGVSDLFEMLFGQHSGQRTGRRNVVSKGEDLQTQTTLSLEEAYHGTKRLIQLNGQTIKVTIKPGATDQQMLRIPDRGARGPGEGPMVTSTSPSMSRRNRTFSGRETISTATSLWTCTPLSSEAGLRSSRGKGRSLSPFQKERPPAKNYDSEVLACQSIARRAHLEIFW